MIAHRSRDTDAAGGTLGLDSGRYIHGIAVQVCSIGDRVANVDPNAEPKGTIRWLISVMDRNLLLDLYGTTNCTVDAIEHYEQRIAPSLGDLAAMFVNRRVYQVAAQCPQPLQSSCVIQLDQTAVTDHVGIDDDDQLAPIRGPTSEV